jgi:hypothetical protein
MCNAEARERSCAPRLGPVKRPRRRLQLKTRQPSENEKAITDSDEKASENREAFSLVDRAEEKQRGDRLPPE